MTAAPTLHSEWYDGRSPRPRPVELWLADDTLWSRHGDGTTRAYAIGKVRWPEHQRGGARQVDLPDGSMLLHVDGAEWDDWCRANGMRPSSIVSWMQSWRGVATAAVGVLVVVALSWQWGIPAASRLLVQFVPEAVETEIGRQAVAQLQGRFLAASEITEGEQQMWIERFHALLADAERNAPSLDIAFFRSDTLGANAFAAPGGHVVLTDALVRLLEDEPDALLGVMAHELGHVVHRHWLDLLVRASLVGALAGLVLGDAGALLAAIPLTLTTQAYSRDAERQADAWAATLLHEAGRSPAVMVVFFERIGEQRALRADDDRTALPIAISSHPHDAERIAWFQDWRP